MDIRALLIANILMVIAIPLAVLFLDIGTAFTIVFLLTRALIDLNTLIHNRLPVNINYELGKNAYPSPWRENG